MTPNDVKETHESYGVMEISRVQHGPSPLFCSSIQHEHTIMLRISAAGLWREHHTDRALPSHALTDRYIEVEMSYTQFAEAITSLNMGAGTPVTVRYANGRHMEPCPYVSKDEQFRAEFESKLAGMEPSIDDAIARTEELFGSKKQLNKADKDELLSVLYRLSREVKANIPYMRDAFADQMDKTLTEAKSNFEGFVQRRMNALANSAITDAINNGGTNAPQEASGGERRSGLPDGGGKPSVLQQIRAGVPKQGNGTPGRRDTSPLDLE